MKPLLATDPPAVGEFALLGRLGAGGMGQVYLGVTRSGRPVAVKMIKPEVATDPAFRARFVREVAAARQVGGFWTASVVAADADADTPWLATEYVPGPSLKQAVEEAGPLPTGAVRVMAARLAEALAAIHAAGLVHRDLKPANVVLAPDGPKVIDFGIARAFQTESAGMTAMIGTPSYMAPEQVRGEPLSPASDVFSLASTLVYALVGRGPFNTGAPEGVIFRVATEPPDLAGVPAELSELLARCLDRDPDRRPTTGQLLAVLGPAAAAVVTPYGGWRPPVHDPAGALAHTAEPPPIRATVQAPPSPATASYPRTVDPAALAGRRGTSPARAPAPSRAVVGYLSPTERLRGEWRQHWIRLVQHLAAGGAALTLLVLLAAFSIAFLDAGWFTAIPVLLGVVVLAWATGAVGAWRVRRLVLTDERVLAIHGVIVRHVAAAPLHRLTDLKYEQTPIARILNYGTFLFTFDPASEVSEPQKLQYLPDPNEIYLRIVDELSSPIKE